MNHPTIFRVAVLATLALLALSCGTESSPTAPAPTETMPAADQSMAMSEADEHMFEFGEPTDPSDADRIIEISTLDELRFDPDRVTVAVDETITFRVTNPGNLPHDFTLADEHGQEEHEAEMAEMAGSGTMMMDEPNGFVVQPGETKELTWHFDEEGEILIGCHQPGHYAAGMLATVTVSS